MYKLILVDDEAEIRQGLKEIIPFESLGFTVAGEAGDGMEALRLCESVEPDLMITDIRMPLMDGLTLCRKAKAILPMLQCIILSGYDDFDFAKQAIELKTMSYLLKPISSSEFKEMLVKARETLDEEFKKRKNLDQLRVHFQESLPVLREALLVSLLTGNVQPQEALVKAAKYQMTLSSKHSVVALFRTGENADG
ncbi:MAG: response regulator, partial [Eubacteriales bacterium]|nr:response regulator [Eubacteriales bacterium]